METFQRQNVKQWQKLKRKVTGANVHHIMQFVLNCSLGTTLIDLIGEGEGTAYADVVRAVVIQGPLQVEE